MGERSKISSYSVDTDFAETALVRSGYPGRVKITGKVTGAEYVWERCGSEVEVSSLDLDYILRKAPGKSCCGGKSDPWFELVA